MKYHQLLVATFTFLALLATPAFAHARLDHSEPRVGSTLSTPPTEVKIWFTEDVDPAGTSVEVKDSTGAKVDKKDLRLDAKDKSLATLSLAKSLSPGKYTVTWHALCLSGHHTKGDFTFQIKGKK